MAEERRFSPKPLVEELDPSSGASAMLLLLPDGLCWFSVLSCLLLACSYVGSLYVWRSDLPRWARPHNRARTHVSLTFRNVVMHASLTTQYEIIIGIIGTKNAFVDSAQGGILLCYSSIDLQSKKNNNKRKESGKTELERKKKIYICRKHIHNTSQHSLSEIRSFCSQNLVESQRWHKLWCQCRTYWFIKLFKVKM